MNGQRKMQKIVDLDKEVVEIFLGAQRTQEATVVETTRDQIVGQEEVISRETVQMLTEVINRLEIITQTNRM